MEKKTNNFWIGEQDLTHNEEFINNQSEELSLVDTLTGENGNAIQSNRRDFLKFLGFGLGAATVAAGCDTPVRRAIPYVVKPEQIVPGVATYYSSSFVDGGDFASIIVKTREGRPIKIEGNDLAIDNHGFTSARVQAAVLSLYDISRFSTPMRKEGTSMVATSWEDLDKNVGKALATARNVAILSNSIVSPTSLKAVGEFADKYNTKVVFSDPVSYAGMLDANEADFGQRVIPGYHFDKVEMVLSFGADFLGTWVNPSKFAHEFMQTRKITDVNNPKISRLITVETGMSLTGSNSDNRVQVKPSEQGAAIAHLYNAVVGGGAPANGLNAKAKAALSKIAGQLKSNAGKSIIISGSNNPAEQMMVNAINNALGNYGKTISFASAYTSRKGSEKDLNQLLADLNAGKVDVLLVNGANPLYSHPRAEEFKAAMAKAKTKVAFAMANDETVAECDYVATVPHFLESWGDAAPTANAISIIQPTIQPLFDSRQMEASLLSWSGSSNYNANAEQPYFDYLKKHWRETVFTTQNEFSSFNMFMDHAMQYGMISTGNSGSEASYAGNAAAGFSKVSKPASTDIEISFYEPINIGNGQFASNPWLMEMPNPVDRTSWGNYLAVPVNFDGVSSMVGYNDLKDGDLVTLTIDGTEYTVPVVQQFGQMPGTVSLALGYGRTNAGVTGSNVGVNVNPKRTIVDGYAQNFNTNAAVSSAVGKEKHFSCVQYHHTLGVKGEDKETGKVINADESATVFFDYFTGAKGFQGALTDRSIIYTSNVTDLKENVETLEKKREHAQFLNSKQIYGGYDDLYDMGHHWGMHVDLNACTGCGACTVACMAENNVPVVGKKEVSRHHEMTWLRIDRYYYGDVENPNAVYQPMMCQHCDNAPCENVCPVNATNHSSEGLNQMTYNRCIGTRYCANNCPYKVRRFNWLDYTTADIFLGNQPSINGEEIPFGADNLTRMVLNPDVTVRSRGVIEKCSFCVQRLQEGKLTAKMEGRRLRDSDVKSACQTACPTGAITFGDMNNKGDMLNQKLGSRLNYIALEEVNVRSSVNYTMKVNNRDESLNA